MIIKSKLKPKYIEKLKKYEKEKTIKIKNVKEYFELE